MVRFSTPVGICVFTLEATASMASTVRRMLYPDFAEQNTIGANVRNGIILRMASVASFSVMPFATARSHLFKDIDGDGKYEISGSIINLLTNNLTREFVGVAYAYVGGRYIVANYYDNDINNNARSMYFVSQNAITANDHADKVQQEYIDVYTKYLSTMGKTYNVTYTVKYHIGRGEPIVETFKAPLNATIDVVANKPEGYDEYALSSSAMITKKLFANKPNVFEFYYTDVSPEAYNRVAWMHPTLDPSNDKPAKKESAEGTYIMPI